MKLRVASAAGFAMLAHWPCLAADPSPATGAVLPTFNGGKPLVSTAATTQSFFANVATNGGPQRTEQLRYVSVYELRANALQAEYTALGAKTDTVEQIGAVVARYLADQEKALQDNLLPQLSQVGGVQATGDTAFVAGNARRADGTFDGWVYAWKGRRDSDASPSLRLQATYKLTPPGTTSEEVTDLQLVDRAANYDDPSQTLLVASSTRVNADCNTAWVNMVSFQGPLSFFQSKLRIALAAATNATQCHSRTYRVRTAPSFYRSPIQLSARAAPDGIAAGTSFAIWAGLRCREAPASAEQICLYKVRTDLTTLTAVTTFGGDGQVIVRAADPALPLRYWDHAIDAEGRVLVSYGVGRSDGSYVPALLRLRADGVLDATFPGNGVHTIPTTGTSTNPRTVTTDINGNIQVTGETYTASTVRPFAYFYRKTSVSPATDAYAGEIFEYNFAGFANSAFFAHAREADGTITAVGTSYGAYPDVSSMRPLVVRLAGHPAGVPAIEYFNAGFGHYISVVNPVEIGKLDSGEFSGWARTGYFFNVYPLGTPGTTPVDRYFTTAFPPKSSHVFSANAAESASIKQNPVWQFEGPVFGALLPSTGGSCPLGTRTVSRVYNNGLTGAPNHRFADQATVIGAGVAAGGVLEGLGPKGAFYCTE